MKPFNKLASKVQKTIIENTITLTTLLVAEVQKKEGEDFQKAYRQVLALVLESITTTQFLEHHGLLQEREKYYQDAVKQLNLHTIKQSRPKVLPNRTERRKNGTRTQEHK